MKSQKGFTLVEGMLVVIALTLISFAGWYVWNAQNKDDAKSIETTSKANKDDNDSDKNLPAGYVEFSDSATGIQFAHPKAWGDAEIKPGPETDHLSKGSEYIISFSNNADVTAGLTSKDWTHGPDLGHGGSALATTYTQAEYKESEVSTEHLNKDGTILFSEGYGAFGCEGVASILLQVLPGNTDYSSIAFLYISERNTDNLDETMCDNHKSYVDNNAVEQLQQIAKTVKNT